MTQYKDLPVYRHRAEILEALEHNQTIIVESPTGSGKTTQIPLILHDAGYSETGIIGITQPRRIAAMSVSEFIREQIHDEGSFCGYTMRFHDTTSRDTRIKIMTDGILLQEVKADQTLSRYSVIMVDEAHERSLNIDFILGLLKEITAVRKDLKVIISSATINTKAFSDFFGGAPIISIDSHPFPVSVNYSPATLDREHEDDYYLKIQSIIKGAMESEEGGDVLVFLPGEGEIKACVQSLYGSALLDPSLLDIYPLYGRLSKEEQEKVFTPTTPGHTKVVVSTNIAETSLTIDGIRTVIDSGWAKVNYYNQRTFTSALIPCPVAKASADQRKGRAGRTAPGVCYRLYSEENFLHRPDYTEEEILHSDLAEVVLRMSELGIYNTDSFPFITEPRRNALQSAEATLLEIGAIKENHHLTQIGEMMIRFPLLPRLSRVIVESILNYPDVMSSVITAVAFLSTKSPFVLPPGEELQARDVHHALQDNTYGDFAAWLDLYEKYVTKAKTEKDKERFCKNRYLDQQTMDEIVHIKHQLEDIVSEFGVPVSSYKSSMMEYLICLASGLRQYICKRSDRYSYRSLTTSEILIHPGSAWFRNMPDYILAGEIVQTTKMYARSVSPLKAEWIERINPFLLLSLSVKPVDKKKTEANKKRKGTPQSSQEELKKYKTKLHGKDAYIVPFGELQSIKSRSDTKIYIKCSNWISKSPIKTSRIDKELSVVGWKKRILRDRPRGVILPTDQPDKILSCCTYILKPFEAGKNTFEYLYLKETDAGFTIVPTPALGGAVKESMYALSDLIELIPRTEKDLRKKLTLRLRAYERALEID
ncbi:MAG: ATP-dependent RNA helicase [Spirochaetales bacterium]|nr:ATP-dependent RNA helicase [Candidatus Physcosoma equi]